MTSDIHQTGMGPRVGRDATETFLSDDEVRKLTRDLRILIASNGTLTRVLGIVADDDIVLQLVGQQIHDPAPAFPGLSQPVCGRVLKRRIFLNGRRSKQSFVAAESLIAIDLLPAEITTRLTETECPIGEIMAASRFETFKETATVWMGQPPDWLAIAGCQDLGRHVVGRRYRVIAGGQPAIVITEYFLRDVFHDVP